MTSQELADVSARLIHIIGSQDPIELPEIPRTGKLSKFLNAATNHATGYFGAFLGEEQYSILCKTGLERKFWKKQSDNQRPRKKIVEKFPKNKDYHPDTPGELFLRVLRTDYDDIRRRLDDLREPEVNDLDITSIRMYEKLLATIDHTGVPLVHTFLVGNTAEKGTGHTTIARPINTRGELILTQELYDHLISGFKHNPSIASHVFGGLAYRAEGVEIKDPRKRRNLFADITRIHLFDDETEEYSTLIH